MFGLFSPKIPKETAAFLRKTLFSNLWDDVWYVQFPRIPSSKKEKLPYGDIEVTHLLDVPHSRQTLVFRKHNIWMGSLVLIHPENGKLIHTLPENTQAALDALIAVVLDVAAQDATARSTPTSAAA